MTNIRRILGVGIVGTALLFFISSFTFSSESYYGESLAITTNPTNIAKEKEVKHLKTPEPLKGVYMTQCVAGTPSFRDKVVRLIDDTELNSIIIDIKDYTGTVSFLTGNKEIDSIVGTGCKVSDMQEFVENLHNKNIYVIGRVTVFQDPAFAKAHPNLAVKRKSDGGVWKDRKGISFIDVGARPFWDYIISIATSSYAIGFDEINFDYIRFPSDGDMKDISFTHTGTTTKKEILRQFFEYLDSKIAGTGVVTSADLFGMTTTNTDDLGIGQVLEYALLNFDYVSPMVYPSHYPPKFNGWPDPNKVPYEIIKFSMGAGVARTNFLEKEIASSTPDAKVLERINPLQLRPWLQDNDYPVHYTAEMVRKQIQATYDVGLTSWMLWDPGNTYTEAALLKDWPNYYNLYCIMVSMDNSNHITYFAETDARNKRVKFGIKDEDRLRHVYSIGKTGMGKSTMLENMAIQDIQNGEGMAFLDPHGKTADLLLDYIPEHRVKDVIYFAPFDTEFPVSFNVMEDVGPERRHLVVSGLMSAFEKIWEDQWSSRMAYILQNTLAALLEYPGATMLGINRMLTDKVYRNKVVDNVTDPTTRSFWVDEFAKYTDKYAAEATPAIQNKVGQFVSNPLIRNIIGQPKSSFDVRKIMDEKKILIVNLSKGLVGEGNANLLGSMLVTKIYLAAMSRADVDPKELKKLPNFYLYVDEFQSFANKSFADILSESRKYKLGLNITHQYIEQMAEEVKAAVFGNVGTMVAFRVGSFDAEILEKEFAPVFTMEDIVNLGLYQVYLKLMIDQVASQPFSATTLPAILKPEISFRDEALEMSRKTYANPKEEVEKAIKEWHLPDSSAVKPGRAGQPEQLVRNVAPAGGSLQIRSEKVEVKKEALPERKEIKYEQTKPIEIKKPEIKEIKIEPPKVEKTNILAKAIGEAIKSKENTKEEMKPEQKKETMSLNELRLGNKNKNKEPSPENVNSLKEALKKLESEKAQDVGKEKTPTSIKSADETKEVPEDVLRKILKGEN